MTPTTPAPAEPENASRAARGRPTRLLGHRHGGDEATFGARPAQPPSPVGSQRAAQPNGTPVAARRRPGLAAAGVALIAVSGLGGWYWASQEATSTPVVTTTQAIMLGTPVRADQVKVTHIAGVSGLPAMTDVSQVVGKRLTGSLSPGALIDPALIVDTVKPEAGTAVVSVALKHASLPAGGITAGESVYIVKQVPATTSSTADTNKSTPQSWEGTVRTVGTPGDDQMTVVDVVVPAAKAAEIAQVQPGQLSLVRIHPKG